MDPDDEFQEVLFGSWLPIRKPFKSTEQLKETLMRKGDGIIRYEPAQLSCHASFSQFSSVVKISANEAVIFGQKSSAGDEKAVQCIQHKSHFFTMEQSGSLVPKSECLDQSPVEVDNYLRYKDVEILFGQDDFLHLYYKGRKSKLQLVGAKYHSKKDCYHNQSKKVFRRGKDLFYQFKFNKNRLTHISLMKLDLDLLIEQLELNLKDPKHSKFNLSDPVPYPFRGAGENFVDFILDTDKLFFLREYGNLTVIDIQSQFYNHGYITCQTPTRHQSLAVAVPGKYFVVFGLSHDFATFCFSLVNHDLKVVSQCTGPAIVTRQIELQFRSNGYLCFFWGHFRRFCNASVGIFIRPVGTVHVVAILGSKIMHICEKGLGKPINELLTPEFTGSHENSVIGIVPFTNQRKYYVFELPNQVKVLSLRL